MKRSLVAIVVVCLATSTAVLAVDQQKRERGTNAQPETIRFRSVETEAGPMVEVRVGKLTFLSPGLTFLGEGNARSEIRAIKDGLRWSNDSSEFTCSALELSTRLGLSGGAAHTR